MNQIFFVSLPMTIDGSRSAFFPAFSTVKESVIFFTAFVGGYTLQKPGFLLSTSIWFDLRSCTYFRYRLFRLCLRLNFLYFRSVLNYHAVYEIPSFKYFFTMRLFRLWDYAEWTKKTWTFFHCLAIETLLRVTNGTTCQKAGALILLKFHFRCTGSSFLVAGAVSGGPEEPEQGGEGGGRGGGGEQDEGGGGAHQVPDSSSSSHTL